MRIRHRQLIISVIFALGLFFALVMQLDSAQASQFDVSKTTRAEDRQSHTDHTDLKPSETISVYLPMAMTPPKPNRGIYGTVYENGVPVPGINVDLIAITTTNFGATERKLLSTITNANGNYSFLDATIINIDTCNCNRYYAVRFTNDSSTYNGRLRNWITSWLNAALFVSTNEYNIGNFDIADVELIGPMENVVITLPYSFTYALPSAPLNSKRILHFSDYKTFATMFDITGSSQFLLSSGMLPTSVQPNIKMFWQIQMSQPVPTDMSNAYYQSAFGNSYYSRTITIANP